METVQSFKSKSDLDLCSLGHDQLMCEVSLLSPRNALRWGYSNAAVVLSVSQSVRPWFRPCVDLVNTIETTPLHISLSNLADMLTMTRG